MNKAILVIDMPESCDGCDFCYYSDGRVPCCQITFNATANCKCPLKPLPEKMEGYNSIKWQWGDYEDGWNHCIDCLIDE